MRAFIIPLFLFISLSLRSQSNFISGVGLKCITQKPYTSAYAGIYANLHWDYFDLGYSCLAGTTLPNCKDIRVTTGIGQMAVPYILSYLKGDPKLVIYGAFIGLILPETFAVNIPVDKRSSLQFYIQPYSAIYSNNPLDTVKKERVEMYGEMGVKYRKLLEKHAVDLTLGYNSNYVNGHHGITLGVYFSWIPKDYNNPRD